MVVVILSVVGMRVVAPSTDGPIYEMLTKSVTVYFDLLFGPFLLKREITLKLFGLAFQL
jgi:hypothetical protein